MIVVSIDYDVIVIKLSPCPTLKRFKTDKFYMVYLVFKIYVWCIVREIIILICNYVSAMLSDDRYFLEIVDDCDKVLIINF